MSEATPVDTIQDEGPVKVCIFGLEEHQPIDGALQASLGIYPHARFVENPEESELVITGLDSYGKLTRYLDPERQFAVLKVVGRQSVPADAPDNVHFLEPGKEVPDLIKLMHSLRKKHESKEGEAGEQSASYPPASTAKELGVLSILVVEDDPRHRESASELSDHDLTVVASYDGALEVLKHKTFDVILTDLKLPMSAERLGPEAFELGKLVDYGLLIPFLAPSTGCIGVVTDTNHHADPISAAFDRLEGRSFQVENALVRFMHAALHSDRSKDWTSALRSLMQE
jgi:CheY-like chemotaxis protein